MTGHRPWLVKIGGCILTGHKDRYRFDEDNLGTIARHLKSLQVPLVLIHGTGFISKSFARKHRITRRRIPAADLRTAAECLTMLREIHYTVLRSFVRQGIPAVSISPFTACRYRQGRLEFLQPQLLAGLLQDGYVPLIHGDLIKGKDGDFHICSSDDLAAAMIKRFPVDKLLLATDVPGIYPENPSDNGKGGPIGVLDPETLSRIAQLPDDSRDVSGGMPAKLKAIRGVTGFFRECHIFNGRSMGAWQDLIHDRKPPGTVIYGQLDNAGTA